MKMQFKRYFPTLIGLIRLKIRKSIYFLGLRQYESTEAYKKIIPAEIKEGRFHQLIGQIASRDEVTSILEIGSSSGEGSTKAVFDSLALIPGKNTNVHCMEISRERHQKLSRYLQNDVRLHPHRLSSVTTDEFPPFGNIKEFYSDIKTNLNKIHIDTIEAWYKKDMDYLSENPELMPKSKSGTRMSGIDWIKSEFGIQIFDFVIIDGGEFTGHVEYKKLLDARYFALDDVCSYKCFEVYEDLLTNPDYLIIDRDLSDRNGWAVFEKIKN